MYSCKILGAIGENFAPAAPLEIKCFSKLVLDFRTQIG